MSDVSSWVHVFHDGAGDTPVVLTFHGTGADEHDPIQLGQALVPGAPVLSPRGRVSERGMNRWFARKAEGVFDVDDVVAQSGDLASFIPEALEHYGLNGRSLVAVGFSNGANMASALALLHPEVVNTVVAFSGMYPFGDQDPIGRVDRVRIFMANGDADPMAPLGSGDRLEKLATQKGATVTRFVRPGGHGITPEGVSRASEWLARETP